jgi:hypothetical protein
MRFSLSTPIRIAIAYFRVKTAKIPPVGASAHFAFSDIFILVSFSLFESLPRFFSFWNEI